MNYLKLVLPAILLTVASFGANASLIDQGDITVDSATGLQWLDLSESVGRSYQDITTQFGTGGDFDGYRYATRDETMQLFTNADISGVVNGYQSINYQPITDFIELFGGNRGMYDWVVSTSVQTWLMLVNDVDMTGVVAATSNRISSAHFSTGSYLVRPSVVPVPAAAWLFGSALLGFFGFSRRKASA